MMRLHTQEDVFSVRHVPSWVMLCFAAGAINGSAVLACERFVTHVTGTVTRLGMEFTQLLLMFDIALVLLFFIAGAMTAGLMINGRAHRQKRPLFSLPLWLVAALTAAIALAGHQGWLGPFGGEVDEVGDFVLLCVLSFAMGLQNAAVATSTGQLVRTTHLTGPATDLGVHFAELLSASGQARENARQHALLRMAKIVAYAVGAGVAVPLAREYEFLSFILPAAVVAGATLLSFAHKKAPELPAPTPVAGTT